MPQTIEVTRVVEVTRIVEATHAVVVVATPVPVPILPTATATPDPTSTAVVPTAEPTSTPLPTRFGANANAEANLRSGPGTEYEIVGSMAPGQAVEIIATNSDGSWYKLSDGSWIAAFLVDNVPLGIPVATVIQEPLSLTPTPLATVVQGTVYPVSRDEMQEFYEAKGIGFEVTWTDGSPALWGCGDSGWSCVRLTGTPETLASVGLSFSRFGGSEDSEFWLNLIFDTQDKLIPGRKAEFGAWLRDAVQATAEAVSPMAVDVFGSFLVGYLYQETNVGGVSSGMFVISFTPLYEDNE